MSIRLKIWLGSMACAALLVAAVGLLASALGSALLAGLLILMVFAPMAWLLARLAYHPVRDVAKTSRSIATTGQLDRRCFYAGPRDDVGELVISVNELLVRYDAAIGRLRRLREAPPTCTCPRPLAAPDSADLVVVDLMARDDPAVSRASGGAAPTRASTPSGVSRPGS